jgi:CRP-like cAMP-binding protein
MSEDELSAQERARYASHLSVFHFGDEIIHEGQADMFIYLLRLGSVGVFKKIHGEQKQIAAIEAVNIFGEMAAIIETARTATIRVLSAEAVIYKFHAFDLKALYSNPAWVELLIKRLCIDVKETNTRSILLESEYDELNRRQLEMQKQCALLLSTLLVLEKDVAAGSVMNSKEWHFLNGMHALTVAFLQNYLPEIYAQTGEEGADAAVETLLKLGIMPEVLKPLLKK